MRQKLLIILIALLTSSVLAGEEVKKENAIVNFEPDAYFPASVTFLIKVTKVSKAIDFLNAEKEYFNITKIFLKNEKWEQLLKDKNISDILNTKSLKDFGVDVNKSFYIARIEQEKDIAETIYLVPITDTKNFPFKVVKLLKRIAGENTNIDLNPAISYYNGFKVFQIQRIFFTIIDDYFILTSSGNSLSEVIDLKSKGSETSLINDAYYKDYKSKYESSSDSNITNIFIKKDFIKKYFKRLAAKQTENKEIKTDISQKQKFNSINYISLNLNIYNNDILLSAAASVNKDDPLGNLFIKAVTTGMFENALYLENPAGYHFISLDINKIYYYLNELEDKDNSISAAFAKFMKSAERKKFIENMVLPCSKSFINIVLKKSINIGEMDNFVLYIPMKECGEIESMIKNIKNELKKRYSANETYGEEKINGYNSFWIKTEEDNKINFLEFNGNLYAGNNVELIRYVLNSADKNIKNDFVKRIDKNTFLFSYTKFDDESFLKAILMMLAFSRYPELNKFINKMDSINLTGEKTESDFIFNLRVKMLPVNK